MMNKNDTSLLSNKDLRIAYYYWMCFALSCQNMERMEGPGFAGMFAQVADKLYEGKEEQKILVQRHMTFYNTQPMVGVVVNGIVLGMEEKKAMGEDVPEELIQSTKTALMGPLAAIGDSLFIGTLIPILLSIALGLTGEEGSVIGPLFYLLSWTAIMLPFSWITYKKGYLIGTKAVESLASSGIQDKVVSFAKILGLVVTGAITAQYVNFGITWSYISGEMVQEIQPVLDGIFPGLLPISLTLAVYYFMSKKNTRLSVIFLTIFVIALLGQLLGILG